MNCSHICSACSVVMPWVVAVRQKFSKTVFSDTIVNGKNVQLNTGEATVGVVMADLKRGNLRDQMD